MKAEKIHPFQAHATRCAKCKSVNINTTSSLVNCCAEGASMLMDFIHQQKAPEVRKAQNALKRQFLMADDGNVYKGTKEQVRILTKYK